VKGRTQKRRLRAASRLPTWLRVVSVLAVAGAVGLFLHDRPPAAVPQAHRRTAPSLPAVGGMAPDGTFTTISGSTVSVASLRGEPTVLWFVTTWCPSCQVSTSALAQSLPIFRAHHVHLVEVELYDDLGTTGPSIGSFAASYAGSAFPSPDWTWGVASLGLSERYDPQAYLDIYYLIDANGRVRFIDSTPVQTMPQLLDALGSLGS